jgi:RNA exonuclease 4
MNKPFFTKKQKKLMKERRKKKKLALQSHAGDDATKPLSVVGPITTDFAERRKLSALAAESAAAAQEELGEYGSSESTTPSGSKKRPRCRSEMSGTPVDPHSSSDAAQRPKAVTVVIPSNLSSKEAKKIRKDARRLARLEGREEVEFVNEKDVKRQRQDSPPADGHWPLPASKKRKMEQSTTIKGGSLFPRINDLVRQAKGESEREKKARRSRFEEKDLPDAYKRRYVALDCEMVGIGSNGKTSALARASIVDWEGRVLLDTFVRVESRVVDFRTRYSGIKPRHIKDAGALPPDAVRQKVADLVKGRVVVGHALKNDFAALMLQHPKEMIRDTAKYRPFQRLHNNKWRPRKLRDLVLEHLGKTIQEGSHDSVTDAASAMELFRLARAEWERELDEKAKKKRN